MTCGSGLSAAWEFYFEMLVFTLLVSFTAGYHVVEAYLNVAHYTCLMFPYVVREWC